MKEWTKPSIIELDISSTEHSLRGWHWDGGYVGDGQLGHQADKEHCVGGCIWGCPEKEVSESTTNPTQQLS